MLQSESCCTNVLLYTLIFVLNATLSIIILYYYNIEITIKLRCMFRPYLVIVRLKLVEVVALPYFLNKNIPLLFHFRHSSNKARLLWGVRSCSRVQVNESRKYVLLPSPG
jgi:hypothetical protein